MMLVMMTVVVFELLDILRSTVLTHSMLYLFTTALNTVAQVLVDADGLLSYCTWPAPQRNTKVVDEMIFNTHHVLQVHAEVDIDAARTAARCQADPTEYHEKQRCIEPTKASNFVGVGLANLRAKANHEAIIYVLETIE
jgi:hypothetical protein